MSYSNEHNKINWQGKFNKVRLLFGPVGPTAEGNQVKMYKKCCFRFITSLKRQGSGSVSNSQIRIKLKSSIRIGILSEKQDPDPYQKGLDPQHCM